MMEKKLDIARVTNAVKDHRFVEALSLIEGNLASDPEHKDSLYLGAVCSRYLKNYEDAKKYIEELLTHAPDMGRAYQELGHLNKAMGDDEKAVTYYRQACELNPALIASWDFLYRYFNKVKNESAANHALEQVNQLKSVPSVLLHINQILNEGNIKDAEAKCRDFLKKNPTNTFAMSLLSEIANRLGHLDDAEFLLENAVKFKPDDPELRKNIY